MGFFSWKTCDSEESIPNAYSNRGAKEVYLLQPGGEKPICEKNYQGYGEFGGVNAHVWLAERNIKSEFLAGADGETKRLLGINLMHGNYYLDAKTGERFAYDLPVAISGVIPFTGNYGTNQPGYGKSPNELIKEGVWVAKPMAELLTEDGEVKFPLKFSFDKDAVYEDLPESEDDPYQGYFY